ncbi:MAG: GNAT family N-acetyltransferase [Clostridia bacterium]|jgi:GNAT superfamily N-acetyltransferase
MNVIKEIYDPDQKSSICNGILRALPSWFGIEQSIVEYTGEVRDMPFYCAFDGNMPIGFIAIKVHNEYTAEICVMGILEKYHRQGIGKMLVDECERYCTGNRMEFLTVKTLDGSRASKSYEKTRLFYTAMGFKPLEVFRTLWDASNPCLFMVKHLVK